MDVLIIVVFSTRNKFLDQLLISYRYSSCSCCVCCCSKSKALSFQIGSAWTLAGLFITWTFIDWRGLVVLTELTDVSDRWTEGKNCCVSARNASCGNKNASYLAKNTELHVWKHSYYRQEYHTRRKSSYYIRITYTSPSRDLEHGTAFLSSSPTARLLAHSENISRPICFHCPILEHRTAHYWLCKAPA